MTRRKSLALRSGDCKSWKGPIDPPARLCFHTGCRGDDAVKAYPLLSHPSPSNPLILSLSFSPSCLSAAFTPLFVRSLLFFLLHKVFPSRSNTEHYSRPLYCKSPVSFFHVLVRKLGHLDMHIHRYVCRASRSLRFSPDVSYCLRGRTSIRNPLTERPPPLGTKMEPRNRRLPRCVFVQLQGVHRSVAFSGKLRHQRDEKSLHAGVPDNVRLNYFGSSFYLLSIYLYIQLRNVVD